MRIYHSSIYFPSLRYIKAGLHEHAEDKPLYEILHACQRGKSHLCIVNNAQGVTTGIITLEDVIEEILQVKSLKINFSFSPYATANFYQVPSAGS